jgi:general secretion pathway protein G
MKSLTKSLLVFIITSSCGACNEPQKSKESALRNTLLLIRAEISQYTLDLHKRPRALEDLISAGYFKQIPADPITGFNETWIIEYDSNPGQPGIIAVHSGATAISSDGAPYKSW